MFFLTIFNETWAKLYFNFDRLYLDNYKSQLSRDNFPFKFIICTTIINFFTFLEAVVLWVEREDT